jgi:hypothetical protein
LKIDHLLVLMNMHMKAYFGSFDRLFRDVQVTHVIRINESWQQISNCKPTNAAILFLYFPHLAKAKSYSREQFQ